MSLTVDRETSPARHVVDAAAQRGRRGPRRESARVMRARELAESPITFHDTLVTQILSGQGGNDALHIPAWLTPEAVDEVRTHLQGIYSKSGYATLLKAPIKGTKAKETRRQAHAMLRDRMLDATKEMLQQVKHRNDAQASAAGAAATRHSASADIVAQLSSIDSGVQAVAGIKGLRELGKTLEKLQRYQAETQRQAALLAHTTGNVAAVEYTAQRYAKSAKALAMIGEVATRLGQRLGSMPDVQQKLADAQQRMTASDRAMTIAKQSRQHMESSISNIADRLKNDIREQAREYTRTNLKKLVEKAVPPAVKEIPSFAEFEAAVQAPANDDVPPRKSRFGIVLAVGVTIAGALGLGAAVGPNVIGQLWHRAQDMIDNYQRVGQGPCTLPADQLATYMPAEGEGSTHPRVVVCYRDSNFDEENHIRLADVPQGAPLHVLFTEGPYRRQTATVSRETYIDPTNGALALMEHLNPFAAGFEMPLDEPEDAPSVSLASVIAQPDAAENALRDVVVQRRRSAPAALTGMPEGRDLDAAYVPPEPPASLDDDMALTTFTGVDTLPRPNLLDDGVGGPADFDVMRPNRDAVALNAGGPKANAAQPHVLETPAAAAAPLFK